MLKQLKDKFQVWSANRPLFHKLFCTFILVPCGIVIIPLFGVLDIVQIIFVGVYKIFMDIKDIVVETVKMWSD